MRRSFATMALLAAIAAGACTDTEPTGTRLRPDVGGPLMQSGDLDATIKERIVYYFPKGLETSTGTKWETVKSKLNAGDVDGARKHLNSLVDWVLKKTPEITPSNEDDIVTGEPEDRSKERAAARLTLYMAIYVYNGADAPLPPVGKDVAVKFVPAGEAATIVTPAKHAALDIPAGSTNEDRIITIIQDPKLYPGHCNGPLPTKLCQYPLFYDIASFPSRDFNNVVGVAVCTVTAPGDDRLPLDAPGEATVHDRLRLARPFKGGARTPGGTLHPDENSATIEILPLRDNQKGLTNCDDIPTPVAAVTPRGGWLGHAQRGMLAVASFAGRLLTPKNLYAYDVGPEHETIGLGSPFNAVDPASQADLEAKALSAPGEATRGDPITVGFTAANTSRRSGGQSTAAADATTATVYLVRTMGGGDDVTPAETQERTLGTVDVPALRPDVIHVVSNLSVTIPADVDLGNWFVEVRVAPNPAPIGEVTQSNNVLRSATPILIKDKFSARAVSSSLKLDASSRIGDVVVDDDDDPSQVGTLNPLSASVSALATNGGTSVLSEARADATWQDAANGQVVFTRVGWTVEAPSGAEGHAYLFGGPDWTYTFTADKSGTFTLQYNVTIDPGTTAGFGLNGFWFSWGQGGPETLQQQQMLCAVPGDFTFCANQEPNQTSGQLTKQVVAGSTYSVRIENQANISGGLTTRTAYLSGTFNWSVTPDTPAPLTARIGGSSIGPSLSKARPVPESSVPRSIARGRVRTTLAIEPSDTGERPARRPLESSGRRSRRQ